jgi:hypothetical protein
MKPRVSLCRFKLALVLAVGLVLYHGWTVAAIAQSALPATVPASVNAIALAVTPNPAKVREKITLTATVTTNKKAATGSHRHFFRWQVVVG